jgi:omega-amidase
MKNSLKVSMIQADIVWENIEENLAHYDNLLRKIDTDTDILILPEMFATGFSMNERKLAENLNGKTMTWLKTSSALYNFAITGSVIIIENDNIFNRLIWMNPSGSFEFYDKRHLFRMGLENKHYFAGTKKLIVEYHGWKICPLVCYDLRFPVWSRNAEGYDILIYIANWPSSRIYAWNSLLKARAIENQCYVLAVNRVGKDGTGTDHSGGSLIIDPNGYVLNDIIEKDEALITCKLDYRIISDLRKKFPVSEDSDNFQIII